ncbi:NADH-FMN oxidoreductase RutF, flavin reductase (DIM6/NTAB) family [Amycolatopsis xylanica]|uniref:NADH-FMN oxidoreductase RutF, flavin reductase (DIM6/NTAB) family n=1 Tax=Amycolatopsis xylanica TaxID=589385 RepID=A0A1H2UVQ0_9PSEU|nr:flavin reductase family protein [Amycolatopsis xylanica]SDW60145.1 NADH-FMN oxidoreductase RutF, flavin reductase (DIM6/NTAB) family [Amycolatopsis xylanica]
MEEFKEAMAALAGGVCVVTAVDSEGAPRGFAATSVTSVSMRPPMLLVCQSKSSGSYPVFANCEHLTVNVLAADQHELAGLFSTPGADRFTGTGFVPGPEGTPVHPDALASVECRLRETVDAGDHSVLMAEVLSVRTCPGEPLIYHDRRYQRLSQD